MNFFVYVTQVSPKLNLRPCKTPKSGDQAPEQHIPKTWERDTAQPVVLAPLRYSLSDRNHKCSRGSACEANYDLRGKHSRRGRGSGHPQVPDTHQNDVRSKISWLVSHGGALRAINPIPKIKEYLFKGPTVENRTNFAFVPNCHTNLSVFSLENTRLLKIIASIAKKTENVKKYENYTDLYLQTQELQKKKSKMEKGQQRWE